MTHKSLSFNHLRIFCGRKASNVNFGSVCVPKRSIEAHLPAIPTHSLCANSGFVKTSVNTMSRTDRKLRASTKSFTLLEIAIAVTLLAMIMTLAAVQVRGYHARQQLEYAAQQVQLRLKGLRQKSMREERTCVVRVDWKNSSLVWSALRTEEPTADDSNLEKWSDFVTLYEVSEPVQLVKPASMKKEAAEAPVYFFKDGRCTPALYQLQHERTKESRWIELTDWSGEVVIRSQPKSE